MPRAPVDAIAGAVAGTIAGTIAGKAVHSHAGGMHS